MIQPSHITLAPDRGAVLTKAALRAADRLDVSGYQLAQILGVSEATISFWRRGEATLEDGSKPFRLAALFVRAFQSLDVIAGGEEAVLRAWIAAPNTALAACPIERMRTEQGLLDVTAYLESQRAPI